MNNRERLVKWTENGGVVVNKEVTKRDTTQKNYVIEKDVAKGIKELAKELGAKNESQMVEEMYYTFVELMEKAKKEEQKKTNKTTKNTKANTETKKEK